MVHYFKSTARSQIQAKSLGKYGDFEYIFALPYDQALQEFKQIHGRTSKPEPKPLPKNFPTCFKCGIPGHISKTCTCSFVQCSMPTCNSQTHNTNGHRVMESLGKAVSSDRKQSIAGI